MLHLVVHDRELATIGAELELETVLQHASLDTFLAVAQRSEAAPWLLFALAHTPSLEAATLTRLHDCLPGLRLAIATSQLLAGEERRLLLAGACRVLPRPWSPLPPTAIFEDRAFLAALFPGQLPASCVEWHRFELPTEAIAASPVLRAILERVEARGASSSLLRSTLPLVLDELLANAMEHGNGWQVDRRVCIELELDGVVCTLRVRDDGNGFDRTAVPDPTSGQRLRHARGRGLYLVERSVDEVSYEDGGRTIVLRTRLQPALSLA